MATALSSELIGRAGERHQLDRMLTEARDGRSATVVLRGEAGVGKTALLRYAAERAAGFRIAPLAGVEAEMELPFAGLHQLCGPMLDRLDALLPPQQAALRVAFGATSGDPPERLLISLATLNLLSAVAEERPVLCLVDDAQWLDDSSAQVAAFVARRLGAESVAMVIAVREPAAATPFAALPQLLVEGLGPQDGRALLSRVVAGRLDDRVADRFVAETHGNPLALVELARGMTAAELAGGFGHPVVADLPSRLEEHYARRIAALPRATQRLVLLAAADPLGDAALVWRAAQALGIASDALTPAEDAELLTIGARVRFGHPLVRSAVYRSASPAEQRTAHRALAAAIDGGTDGDRRAWHRAAAADGVDERVASELEDSADRARARGGLAAAAAFLRRSVALTRDRPRQVERALAAAQASLQAGAFDAARGMLATAGEAPLDALQRARIDLLHGQIAFAEGLGSAVPPLLLAAAEQLVPLDLDLARETYLNACGAAMYAGPASADILLAAGRAARALAPPAGAPRAADTLLEGIALLVTDGRAAAAPALQRATRAFSGEALPVAECLRWGGFATAASNALWDHDGLRSVCARQLEVARAAGALGATATHLLALGTAQARAGDFAAAAALMAEVRALTEATGTRLAPYNEMLVLALRGSTAEAEALIEATVARAADRGQGQAVTVGHWAASILYNGLGRFDDAREAGAAASSTPLDMFAAMWSLPELAEAAVRTGSADVARDAVARLTETTRPASTDFGLGVEARSRALISEGEAAEAHYREAIDRLGRTPLRADFARARLLYGEWLRRQGRRTDARDELHAAREMLAAMGIEAFAERAERELAATGVTVDRRPAATRDALTDQERQIAQLARDGYSNPEIGARCFLSPRTVEWHLHKVFAKLGIRSRRQLARALPTSNAPAADR